MMSEYRKQAAFLKTLIAYADTPEHRGMAERLCHAEKNERCLLCACRLVGLIALLGLAGLGYSAVLLPEFFDHATHIVIQVFSAVGLGSLLCLVVFLGLWLWYRSALNRIHDEYRRIITKTLETRFKTTATKFYPLVVEDPHLRITATREVVHVHTAVQLSASKAS